MRKIHPRPTERRSPVLRRQGFSTRGLLLGVGVILIIPAIGWSVLPSGMLSSGEGSGPMMQAVERGDFIHDVTARGSLESASNTDIVSKVRSMTGGGVYSSGTAILSVVDEGYIITQEDVDNGKILVELDYSQLDNQLIQQEIVCATSKAMVTQAENAYETAEIDLKEYQEGTYEQELLQLGISLTEAQAELEQAEEYLKHSRTMYEKGYFSRQQLQSATTSKRQAENKVKFADKNIRLLNDYTKAKKELALNAAIATAKAKLDSEKSSHELDNQKLALIKEQIANCTIRATATGQVVYANREGHRGESDVVIEPGTLIRERQTILRLPDPSKMQVKARINEARVSAVAEGMSVQIQLDAFPDAILTGTVTSVADYPASGGWFRSDVKEYETLIAIDDPSGALPEGETIRPGLTAQVKIRVDQQEDVLQLPVQAVIEHGDKHYCVMREGRSVKKREIKIGASNDKHVVIAGGIEEGDEVVLNSGAYREDIDLPELPPAGAKRTDSSSEAKSDTTNAAGNAKPGGNRPAGGQRPGGQRSGGAGNPMQMFARLDKDSDGKVTTEEMASLPAPAREGLAKLDTNGDGAIDRKELAAMAAKAGGRTSGAPGGGRPGGSSPGGGGGRPAGARQGGSQ